MGVVREGVIWGRGRWGGGGVRGRRWGGICMGGCVV